MQEKLTAALYVRVSTEEQAEEGQSAPAQVETLKQYCSAYGIEVYDVYMDLGFSGKRLKDRMGLERLIKDCKNGSFNLVLVWKISRLSRSLKDLLYLIDIFEASSVHFTSCSERFDTSTPVGRMTLQLLGSIAEFERNTIIENVKLGLGEFARKGGKASTVLGYDNVDKKLVINENEVGIVRMIFSLYTGAGMSYSAVAEHLNSMGFRTKRGYRFRGSSIAYILHNPVYIGINRHRSNTGDSYGIKGQHPSIIDTEIWNAAQNSRPQKPKSTPGRTVTGTAALRVICSKCLKPMRIFYASSHGKKYVYYRCTVCSNYVNSEKLKASVEKTILRVISDKTLQGSIYRLLKDSSPGGGNKAAELTAIDSEIGRLKKSKARYFKLFEGYKLSDTDTFVERIAAIEECLKLLEIKRQEICSSFEAADDVPHIEDYFDKLKDRLSVPDAAVMQLTAALVKEIEVYKDDIDVVLYL